MGCQSFLEFCWGFCVESTVQELRKDPLPRPEGSSIRACPDNWTMGKWQEVYGFSRQGAGWTSLKKEEYAKGRFSTKDAKNGYAVQDCLDPRAKRVFAFLVPILHPEKPTRVTITLANTVYGSYLGERAVNWGLIVKDVVARLTRSINNTKRSPICPFLIHLYHHFKETTAEEATAHGTQLMMRKFEGTESEPEPGSEGGSSSSQSEEESQPPPKRQRQRVGGTPSTRTRAAIRAAATGPPRLGGRTYQPTELIEALRVYVEEVDRTLGQVSSLVGNPPCQRLVSAVKEKIGGAVDLRALESKVDRLTVDLAKMRSRAVEAERSCKGALLQANASAAALLHVEEALQLPAEVVMKARMFDAKLERDNHISSKRVIAFMMEQTVRVEAAYTNMRTLVGNLTHILPTIMEDSGSSDREPDLGSETDQEEQGPDSQRPQAKEVVDLGSPDLPAHIPTPEFPQCPVPSEFMMQARGGRQGTPGVPRFSPSQYIRGDVTPPPTTLSVQGTNHHGRSTSESSAFKCLPLMEEGQQGPSTGQGIIQGARSQAPAFPARTGPQPGTPPALIRPPSPDLGGTPQGVLPRPATPQPAPSPSAEQASTLVTLAAAASNPTSSRSSRKRRRREERRRLEELARN